MNVNDRSSQWGLLSQAYNSNTTNQNDISGYSSNRDSNTIFNTQKTQKTQGIDSLFEIPATQSVASEIEDSFSVSSDLKTMQDFARNFKGTLEELGSAMVESGILNKEEKVGFDVLYKFNPSLDAQQTENILQNTNLSKENANFLSQVNQKIGAVRYFGGF